MAGFFAVSDISTIGRVALALPVPSRSFSASRAASSCAFNRLSVRTQSINHHPNGRFATINITQSIRRTVQTGATRHTTDLSRVLFLDAARSCK